MFDQAHESAPATAGERLRLARTRAGLGVEEAAAALGYSAPGYRHWENGQRGFARHADRLARFFRVRLDWLVTGRGEMTPGGGPAYAIPVEGRVGAGARIDPSDDDLASLDVAAILPRPDTLAAVIVSGDSQWPRFQAGEALIYPRAPQSPEALIGRYAIVQEAETGHRYVKTIVSASGHVATLGSHNAPPRRGVALLAAWPVICVILRDGVTLGDAAAPE